MTTHRVDVSFVLLRDGEHVIVEPKVLPDPEPKIVSGDTVTWVFEGQREVQVIFPQVRDFADNTLKPGNPLGPFSQLTVSQGQVEGVIRGDVPSAPPGKRYLCQFFSEGKALPWANPIDGETSAFGGGLDIPMKPPG